MKYIIIGGVASGASFACRLRRLDENADIVIYEKTNFISYANCGLPYYVSSIIKDKNTLVLQTPDSLKKRFNIDVHTLKNVIAIDRENKRITIKDEVDGSISYDNYDKLILAMGAIANKIVPNSDNIFELKTVEDSYKIREYIIKHKVHSATIIGGGFIGLEIAENLQKLNIKTTIIEASDHVLTNFDPELSSFINLELMKNGIDVFVNSQVEQVISTDNEVTIKCSDKEIKSDILIQALGVKPNSSLAKESGLELSIKGTVKVDSNYQTSDANIYAIGDLIALPSIIDNELNYIPLAGLANREGRDLATYLITTKSNPMKSLGTSIVKIFSLTCASTGYNEKTLKKKNIAYDKIYLSPNNHASYYPGASQLIIKVLYSKDDYQILGGMILGQEGVDKRIDVLSLAIKNKMKAYELKDSELSYAPPYSSAKDPINMIGFMIENIKDGLIKQFYPEDVESLSKDKNVQLVDVRTKEEYSLGHIENSINIPLDELREKIDQLDKEKVISLICQSAIRSYLASRILVQKGYTCQHLAGGYNIYSAYLASK